MSTRAAVSCRELSTLGSAGDSDGLDCGSLFSMPYSISPASSLPARLNGELSPRKVVFEGCRQLGSNADVFIPQVGLLTDEISHQLDALRIVNNGQVHAALPHVSLGPLEGLVLAHDDTRNRVE